MTSFTDTARAVLAHMDVHDLPAADVVSMKPNYYGGRWEGCCVQVTGDGWPAWYATLDDVTDATATTMTVTVQAVVGHCPVEFVAILPALEQVTS